MLRRTILSFAAVVATVAAEPVLAQTSAVVVTVNGTRVRFDQQPIEVAGRVFVPLRGVFERLGASVVFHGGTIDATRGNTTMSLHLGDPHATLNGRTVALERPAFVAGARTLVPLRFIAQTLGATVSYLGPARTVAITQPGTVVRRPPTPTETPHARTILPIPSTLGLLTEEPRNGTTVVGLRPKISATFVEPVDPNSIHIRIDGRDVAMESTVSVRNFSFSPTFDIPPGRHRVDVGGLTAAGRRAVVTWFFDDVKAPEATSRSDQQPGHGNRVGNTFIVQGGAGSDDVRFESHVPYGTAAVSTLRFRPR